ncbi:fimbria/pilus outer membrane usher protein [Pseudoxanthomonas winnipegensis]|uniref:fimbria/pilus outer membrane usher protein n=1 Tax=Pseudoxanthomonas winnipegensis TaxID=2480810 RepID=UPI00103B5777|nr:fimbria/pilus outer membrane usher protein [Pseudoxanthomonas winnipegensis]TBV69176.1 hypothetical protein EYC45_19855 [Pseudoxanthomonas winnipegensis]
MNTVQLVIQDEFGRTTTLARDVYVTRANLPKGTTEWSVTAGLVREERYVGDTYKTPAVDAQVFHGVNDRLSVGGSVQATADAQNITGRAAVNLGRGGGLTVDVSQSQSAEGHGGAYAVAYEKRGEQWSFTAAHMQKSGNYWELNDELDDQTRFDVRSATAVGVNWTQEDGRWSVSGAFTDIGYDNGRRTQSLGARVRWDQSQQASWTFGASHDFIASDTSVGVSFGYRFGTRGRYSSAVNVRPSPVIEAGADGKDRYNTTISNSISNEVAVGNQVWDYTATAAYDQRLGPRVYGSVATQTKVADISVEAYADREQQWVGGRMEGSVWIGEGGVSAQTKNAGTSYIVAEVPGQAGVPVNVGGIERTTNAKGIAVIPGVAPLRNNHVDLDTRELPIDVRIPQESVEVGTPRVGGAKVVFAVDSESMREFVIEVDGVPAAIPAQVTSGDERVPVGSGGVFVLNKPTPGAKLTITTAARSCTTTLPQTFGVFMERTRIQCVTGERP